MSRESLGHFELLVLLALLRQGEEAYGVPIAQAIEQSTGKPRHPRQRLQHARASRREGPRPIEVGRADGRARRPRQTVFCDHRRGLARGQGREKSADRAVAGHPRPRGMNMVCSRFVLRLLARADASGTAGGARRRSAGRNLARPIAMVAYQQLIGLYGVALAAHARHHARLRPTSSHSRSARCCWAGFDRLRRPGRRCVARLLPRCRDA